MNARTQARTTSQRQSTKAAVPVAAPVEPARLALYATVALVNVAVLTNLFEPFQLAKQAVLVVGGAVLLGLVAWELAGSGAVRLPVGRVVVGVGAFLGLMGLVTVINAHRLQSLFGEYGRSTGLLVYAAAAVVFLSVIRTHGPEDLARLALVVLASAVPVVGLGLLQVLGFQPLGLSSETSAIVGTLGQANFVAGYAGTVLPFALWAAIRWRRSPLALAGAVALAAALVVVGIQTKSFQALPAMAVGALVVGLVVVHQRAGARAVGILLGVIVAFAVLLGLAGHGYLDREIRSGLDERVLLWEAGRDMVLDRPVLGAGPAGYAANFSVERPAVHARKFGIATVADAPHDVPLWMFVTGGVPLGLLYLALVGATGVQLVRGLRRADDDRRLLLGAFGGAWAAYQVQALVSIETPTLLVGHAVTAAAIWVLAGGVTVRTVHLPALAPIRSGASGLVRRGTVVRAGAVALIFVALWAVTLPVRADVAYRRSLELTAGGDLEGAQAAAHSATALTPWNGRLWAQDAAVLARQGYDDLALKAGWKAAQRVPSFTPYAITAGQVAHQLGKTADADRYFRFAVQHGPGFGMPVTTRATFLLDVGRTDDAIRELVNARLQLPDDVEILTSLGAAYDQAERPADARHTWERVLELAPSNAAATAALAQS